MEEDPIGTPATLLLKQPASYATFTFLSVVKPVVLLTELLSLPYPPPSPSKLTQPDFLQASVLQQGRPEQSQATCQNMATTNNAMQSTFQTPELLEQILLQVDDLRTLLFSQRVSQQFLQTIQGSKRLQEELFFRVKWPAPQTADDSEIEVNPINPLLLSQKHRIGIHSVDIEVQHYRKDKLNFFGFLDIHLVFDPVDHMKELEESDWEGSWRKMLIVQPRSIKYDRWQLSHQFAVGSRWTTSAGRGGWHDAYTMDGLVRELLERVEELKACPWGDCDTNVRPADADTWEHL
ncbi:unnamed protein product [Zymoseptoria tritici ST99CH_1A5]|uniref:F-box domain-containing protein n=1 Tax=Zymoseptoria tritici ST99CH_1A5 TaxID=1276529 RepID=A0A1Y6M0R9_ZYMTR|nr:unnamed protein product [Zymoseptoria tritici ST99CH_1A5]